MLIRTATKDDLKHIISGLCLITKDSLRLLMVW